MKFLWFSLLCLASANAQSLSGKLNAPDSSQATDTGLVYLSGDTLNMGSSKIVYDTLLIDSSGVATTNSLPPGQTNNPENSGVLPPWESSDKSNPAEPHNRPERVYTADKSVKVNGFVTFLVNFFAALSEINFSCCGDQSSGDGNNSADRSDRGSHDDHSSNLFGGSSRPSHERGVQH